MAAYSNSLLSTYEQCPLKYKLRYRDKIKRDFETAERFLGKMIHFTLRKCYDDYRFDRDINLDGLLNYFISLWEHRWNDSIMIMNKDKTQEDYKLYGKEMLGNYYQHYSPFDSDLTIDTELPVSFFLDDTHKYRMIGYIDRLSKTPDGVVQIHDYKTSVKLAGQAEVDADRQLALYQIGVQQRWPDFKNIQLIWHYLSFDKELVSSRNQEDIHELAKNTISLIDEIETTTDFSPRESGLCDWCEYPDLCPMRKHHEKVKSLMNSEYVNEPGVILVDKYSFLKNMVGSKDIEIEKAKIALLEYARREGIRVVRGSEYQVRIKPVEKLILPGKNEIQRKELENMIYETGKWEKVFQTGITSLAGVVDNKLYSNELVEEVMKQGINETDDVIQISKIKGKEK